MLIPINSCDALYLALYLILSNWNVQTIYTVFLVTPLNAIFFNQSHRQHFTFMFPLRCFWCLRTEVTTKWYHKILMLWGDASNTFILNRTAWPPEFWHWLDNVTSHWPLCVFGDMVACCDLHVLVTTSIGLVRGWHHNVVTFRLLWYSSRRYFDNYIWARDHSNVL